MRIPFQLDFISILPPIDLQGSHRPGQPGKPGNLIIRENRELREFGLDYPFEAVE